MPPQPRVGLHSSGHCCARRRPDAEREGCPRWPLQPPPPVASPARTAAGGRRRPPPAGPPAPLTMQPWSRSPRKSTSRAAA
eukprot:2447467-Pleurochrysis_carterae.AAC.3